MYNIFTLHALNFVQPNKLRLQLAHMHYAEWCTSLVNINNEPSSR